MLDDAASLPSSDVRKALTLASIALLKGTGDALKKSLEITTDDQERGKALVNAGIMLIHVRKYARGRRCSPKAGAGRATRPRSCAGRRCSARPNPTRRLAFPATEPAGVPQQALAGLMSGRMTLGEFKSLVYIDPQLTADVPEEKQFQQNMAMLRCPALGIGLPRVTIADMVMSNMHYTVDGDDNVGYKIIMESPGAAAQEHAYVTGASGHYQVAGFSATGNDDMDDLAILAMRAAEKNNLAAARKWLDRARERIQISGGDDPLEGPPFPYFWTKGQAGDAGAVRTAALALLPSKSLKGPIWLPWTAPAMPPKRRWIATA